MILCLGKSVQRFEEMQSKTQIIGWRLSVRCSKYCWSEKKANTVFCSALESCFQTTGVHSHRNRGQRFACSGEHNYNMNTSVSGEHMI